MRIVIFIVLISSCGCHFYGGHGGTGVVHSHGVGKCNAGSGCRTCHPVTRFTEWSTQVTFGCFGRHPKYAAGIDNLTTRYDARTLAREELKVSRHRSCQDGDFRRGFEQAFVDVSQGGKGDLPALPPPNFWTNCARTPDGHQRAQNWFAGYEQGAVAAKTIYEPYNKVAASQFFESDWSDQRPQQAGYSDPSWGTGSR